MGNKPVVITVFTGAAIIPPAFTVAMGAGAYPMNTEKSIVIGCDNTSDLSVILHSIQNKSFQHNIVSATRITDLISIANSLDPDLLIVCFRNNQLALNDLSTFLRKQGMPLLCIMQQTSLQPLSWSTGKIVFTCFLQHVANSDYFISTINSIFLLEAATQNTRPPVTAPAPVQQQSQLARTNLSRYVMELDKKTEVLSKVKERIAELYPRVDHTTRASLNSIVNAIKMSANDQQLWEDFKLYFEMTDPGFLLLLAQKHPDLTAKDIKYCCYLKMNMSNDDIRSLLGINQESVRTHKYRLKKKMMLHKDQDLRGYLLSVN
jgi:DNA-binding CsgD family transcriptional regulator